MGILGFLQNVASNFVNHYQDLSSRIGQAETKTTIAPIPQATTKREAPVDSYEPSHATSDIASKHNDEAKKTKKSNASHTQPTKTEREYDDDHDDKHDAITPSSGDTTQPEPTYSFQRKAELKFKLNLEFDLAAMQRTATMIEDGEVTSFEQLSSAGFGLHTDFKLSGEQFVRSTSSNSEVDSPNSQQALAVTRSKQASAFRANSRDFAVESFFNEASKLKRFSSSNEADGYRQTINKFAFRYRSDSSFSFGNLERFNVQSNRVANEMPESFGSYVDSAGRIASSGSNDMMSTFFDTVDQYLDGAEEKLLQTTISAFDAAAAELGFEGEMVTVARDQLISSIEGFFDRVDTAVSSMQSNFVTQSSITQQPPSPQINPAIMHTPDVGIAQQQPYVATA